MILAIALGVGIFLVGQRTSFFGFAAPPVPPEQVKITNISDNSFTVSWLTQTETIGFISFGVTDKLEAVSLDDRDTDGQKKRRTHHVTIKNLDPTTVYYFKIGSGSKLYDNKGTAYSQNTAPTTSDPPPIADPAFGKILASGVALGDALVYLTVAGGSPLSSFTRSDGNWLITLNNARSADLSSYISYKSEGDNIDIFVSAPEGIAQAKTDTKNHNPVPNITIGDNYDFAQKTQQQSSSFSLKPIETVSEAEDFVLAIKSPADDVVVSSQPKFTGTGKPGEVITITIESVQKIEGQATVAADGTWSYTPAQKIAAGDHTITVAQAGKTTSSNFSVLGTSATASATARVSMPSTASGIPVSGAVENTILLMLGGIIFLFAGTTMFIKKSD